MKICTVTNKVYTEIKRHKFIIAILIAAVIKQLLVYYLPIYALPTADGDDNLFCQWSYSILQGQWLGVYDRFTFMKTAGFSLYLAFCFKTGISYIAMTTFLYSTGCFMMVSALLHFFQNRKVMYVLYLLVLFNPASFALETLQRVYRSGIGMAITLMVFASLLQLYAHIQDDKIMRAFLWSLCAGATLGFLWILKSDTIWILPFAMVVLLICAGVILWRKKTRMLCRILILVIPILGIVGCEKAHDWMNVKYYGYSSIEYYEKAVSNILNLSGEKLADNISLSHSNLDTLCEYSKTLASVKTEIETEMEFYGSCDSDPLDGETEDGWIEWAIISGISDAGYYSDAETANAFYKSVYEELEAVYQNGSLIKDEKSFAESYYLDSWSHVKILGKTVIEAIKYMISFEDAEPQMELSQNNGQIRSFEEITGNVALYEKVDYDYSSKGWIVFANATQEDYVVYLEDDEGNKVQKVDLTESGDVEQLYPELIGAKRSRFQITWNKSGNDTEYYMVAYQDGVQIGKAQVYPAMFTEDDSENVYAYMEEFFCNEGRNEFYTKANIDTLILQVISKIYQVLGRGLCYAGFLSYILYSFIILIWREQRDNTDGNCWLILTGFILSIVVFLMGMSITQLTKCETIKCMYLCAVYALFVIVSFLSCYMLERKIRNRIKRS